MGKLSDEQLAYLVLRIGTGIGMIFLGYMLFSSARIQNQFPPVDTLPATAVWKLGISVVQIIAGAMLALGLWMRPVLIGTAVVCAIGYYSGMILSLFFLIYYLRLNTYSLDIIALLGSPKEIAQD